MPRNEAYLARKKARREAMAAKRRPAHDFRCLTCGQCKCVGCGDWCSCDVARIKEKKQQ